MVKNVNTFFDSVFFLFIFSHHFAPIKSFIMLKNELVQQLRERQYKLKFNPKSAIDALNDDQIINAYVTCSCCGKSISEEQLAKAIHKAYNIDDFFDLSQPHQSDDSKQMCALAL
ncbi:MAG: hypothetical protein EOO04_24010 [Chitinophagaceae bacterium]|nr:MAG: hypothetical protein EOO04_24010 [Chitinophagaceae bacterium]